MGEAYLSLGEQDVGDDVREAAAEHQHHAVLAVGDTGHLHGGGVRYYFALIFMELDWCRGVTRGRRPLLPGGCRNTFCRRRAGLAGRPGTTSCKHTNNANESESGI